MTQDYPKPIAPPPELVEQWIGDYYGCPVSGELAGVETAIAARAAQWGSDQELKACCHYFARDLRESLALELRAARRPMPMSLKEQALNALDRYESGQVVLTNEALGTIRRALEQLPENE